MQTVINLIFAVVYLEPALSGSFYTSVRTKVPFSGILKRFPGVTKRVCVQKCRLSDNCNHPAIALENDDCLHLDSLAISNKEVTIDVNLLEEISTDLKVPGKCQGIDV